MRRSWVKIAGIAAVVIFSASVGALASSLLNAQQSGVHQSGGAQAGRLTIRVEQALADPASDLLPDSNGCPTVPNVTPPTPVSSPACPGGALDFTIENTSNVPVRVTKVAATVQCSGPQGQQTCNPAVFASDKNTDGSFVADETSGSCGASASFTGPDIVDALNNHSNIGANFLNSRPWPIIPAHGTLVVNGTDANALGLGLVHLSNSTAQGCQSATLSIPLTITAVPS